MPYEMKWYVENRVIYAHVWGNTTIDEMRDFGALMLSLVEAGTPPIYYIFDGTDIQKMPMNFSQSKDALRFARHEAMGGIIGIGRSNPLVQTLSMVLTRLFRVNYRQLPTFQDAIAFLKDHDQTIDWSQVNDDIFAA